MNLDGAPIDGPSEWTPALTEVLVDPEERKEVHLRVQGEVMQVYLKHVAGEERVLVDWPRSDCGHYRLQLGIPEGSEQRLVTISPQKISRDEYTQMLEDLETRLPAAVALALKSLSRTLLEERCSTRKRKGDPAWVPPRHLGNQRRKPPLPSTAPALTLWQTSTR